MVVTMLHRYLPFARLGLLAALPLVGVLGCSASPGEERVGTVSSPVTAPLAEAYCTAVVDGVGSIDAEQDYLPNVVNCEDGAAGLEALKAQAIAARSAFYYAMGTHGSICDSQSCQVYSCGKTPSAIHHQAVDETSGVYLAYNGNVTYGAYLAGDPATAPPSCIGAADSSYVTYNEGKSGTDVEQTTMLWVWDPADAGYGTNRGCMSQNGANCLDASLGYDDVQILQFYFGADIQLVQAPGSCVLPLPGEGGAGGAAGAGTGGGGVGGAAPGGFGGGNGAAAGAGATGGGMDGVAGDDDEGSCNCRASGGGAGQPHTGPWLAAAAWALAWGRARRRSRVTSAC
jgi:MYXO-CTERM domain-containing protein